MPRYLLLVVLLAVAVPFQAALAASTGPETAVEKCHEGHDGHGKTSGSHCGACCTGIAVAGVIHTLAASALHGTAQSAPARPPLGALPDGIDRPPRSP